MKKVRLIAGALLVVLMGIALFVPLSAAGAASHSTATTTTTVKNRFTGIHVSGTAPNGDTFKGVLNITSFAAQGSTLVAVGTVSGTLRDSAGKVIKTVTNQAVTSPTTFTVDPTCTLLTLMTGPITLFILGITVSISPITIIVTATTGTLLGNLLCSLVTTPPPTLQQIVTILNEILALLGGL